MEASLNKARNLENGRIVFGAFGIDQDADRKESTGDGEDGEDAEDEQKSDDDAEQEN